MRSFRKSCTISVAVGLLAASCVAEDEIFGEFEGGDIEERFIVFGDAENYLISQITTNIGVCLTGDGVTTTTRSGFETTIRNAIMAWVDAVRPTSTVALVDADDITFTCSGADVNVNWDKDAGRANAPRGQVNLFGGDTFVTVMHEFGHIFALGDTYVEGVWTCQPGQPNSVMCGSGGIPSTLQADDINGIQEIFAMAFPDASTRRWSRSENWCGFANGQLFIGDFNGDGNDDMLCHDASAGDKWIDYAISAGQFGGTNWHIDVNWCNHASGRVHVGDFNGDGFDDLLCHDVSNGAKWIDYADGSGHFEGTNWQSSANWCGGAELHIGDFNNDSRDDMLCHRPSDGYKWIDYASSSGQFGGTDWERDADWCGHSGARLYVGDFTGDGWDDLLCHDANSGYKWIDHANAAGQFNGTNWELNMRWCHQSSGQLFVDDFNGDGRDDMLCHDANSGHKWISFANNANGFDGTSRDWPMAWCYGNQFLTGDFDENGVADFLCHDPDSGEKWIAYQEP